MKILLTKTREGAYYVEDQVATQKNQVTAHIADRSRPKEVHLTEVLQGVCARNIMFTLNLS